MTPFEHWWYHEGSQGPTAGSDLEEHCKRMCAIAWQKGAYKALEKAEKQSPIEIWRSDTPPKRGAYKVKRDGASSVQRGFAYWDGTRWGMIFSRRSLALEYMTSTRNRSSKYTMQWLQKLAHGIKGAA